MRDEEEMSEALTLYELKDAAYRLNALMMNPRPGLITWVRAVQAQIDLIARCANEEKK